jgi:phospholipase/carboxylesterase
MDFEDALPLPYLLREPAAQPAGAPPLLILLHGYGSDATGLFALAERLDGRFLVVVPQGPLPLSNGGWGWYALGEETPMGRVVDAQGMEESRRAVLELATAAAREHGGDAGRVFLLGHSQGAALALCLAVTEPERLAGVAAMSGRIIPEIMPRVAAPERMHGLPVLLAHGVEDPVVPVRHARAARELLASWGVHVDYREYDAGHTVPPGMLDDVNAWLAARAEGG